MSFKIQYTIYTPQAYFKVCYILVFYLEKGWIITVSFIVFVA